MQVNSKSHTLGQIWDQIEIFLQNLEKRVNLILLVSFGTEQKYFLKTISSNFLEEQTFSFYFIALKNLEYL